MRDIALYYPYIHVRDDAWLKAAALYWPKIARIVPDGYPVADSEIARKLSGELDFILGINPGPYAHSLRAEFSDFIKENRAALQKRYYLPHSPIPGQPYESWKEAAETISKSLFEKEPGRNTDFGTDFGAFEDCFPVSSLPLLPFITAIARLQQHQPVPQSRAGSGLAWLRMDGANTRDLRDQLFRTGLGRPAGAEWVVVAPDLAALYIAALAERVATANDLAVVTDNPDVHGILSGWDVRTTAQALIGRRRNPSEPANDTDQVSAMYAAVAIQAVSLFHPALVS